MKERFPPARWAQEELVEISAFNQRKNVIGIVPPKAWGSFRPRIDLEVGVAVRKVVDTRKCRRVVRNGRTLHGASFCSFDLNL